MPPVVCIFVILFLLLSESFGSLFFRCFAIKIAVHAVFCSREHFWPCWRTASPNFFFPKLGHGNSTDLFSQRRVWARYPRLLDMCYLWPEKADERTEGALHVTDVEFELHTNVYSWNNSSVIMVISRCFMMVDLWKALHYRSMICYGEKNVTLSLIYHKLPCSNVVKRSPLYL